MTDDPPAPNANLAQDLPAGSETDENQVAQTQDADQKQVAGENQDADHPQEQLEYRLWTDATGKKRVRAAMLRMNEQKQIEIKLEDGRVMAVDLNRFSPADVYYAIQRDLEQRQSKKANR